MKRFFAILLAVVMPLSVTAYANDAVETRASSGGGVGAAAAVVMEAQTGRVLFAQNEDEKLPIASTTKIMTALLALEQPDIDASFVVDENAILVEGSSMGLQKGDIVSLKALAVGMLLASGNDGANAAAVRIAGSTQAFAQVMNARARELGMQNTSFETPSGLDGEAHYSTAYDMALLTRAALDNVDFAEICSQYRMRTSYGNPPYDRWLTNHNKLLNYYEGTVGVKTGFTKKAGRCLVSAVERGGITLICVTLDCPDDWSIHKNLYDRHFGDVEVRDLSGVIPLLKVPVAGGTAPDVKAAVFDSANVPVPVGGAEITYRITAEKFLYAPVLPGAYVGEADIFIDGKKVYSLTVVTSGEVGLAVPYKDTKSLGERIKAFFEKEGK